jgi:hypothetical protein
MGAWVPVALGCMGAGVMVSDPCQAPLLPSAAGSWLGLLARRLRTWAVAGRGAGGGKRWPLGSAGRDSPHCTGSARRPEEPVSALPAPPPARHSAQHTQRGHLLRCACPRPVAPSPRALACAPCPPPPTPVHAPAPPAQLALPLRARARARMPCSPLPHPRTPQPRATPPLPPCLPCSPPRSLAQPASKCPAVTG